MNDRGIAPIHLYVERDGPGRDGRVGRSASISMDGDLHVIVSGKSEKVMTFSACWDAATGRTSLRVSVGDKTMTETYVA